ncbi:hypothetical protein [Microvirga sp. TS319]|uniref:hypothetical protein n=1 Tax=Microvirga sp. TS319 TaxID=3241165 RepID=UPI00351A2BBC
MTDLDEMKNVIVATVRDEELASSACYEIDGYAKLWPFVLMVNDWDVWNRGKSALRPEVLCWLEESGVSYDLHLFLSGGGLFGFKTRHEAAQFTLKWSRKGPAMPVCAISAPDQSWNPHPIKSTFEPPYLGAA